MSCTEPLMLNKTLNVTPSFYLDYILEQKYFRVIT